MDVLELVVSGLCLGVSEWIDYDTKQPLGVVIDLGFKKANGKFAIQTIKVEDTSISDFDSYVDSFASLTLSNASISTYMQGNRPALSIKAKAVHIDEQVKL